LYTPFGRRKEWEAEQPNIVSKSTDQGIDADVLMISIQKECVSSNSTTFLEEIIVNTSKVQKSSLIV